MLKNYLTITLRKLGRDKIFALVNITGLSIAVACCIVIGIYLKFQLGYDKHFVNADRTYRVIHSSVTNGTPLYSSYTSAWVGPTLLNEFPEVENFVRLRPFPATEAYFEYNGERLAWEKVFYADETLFDMFNHEVLAGDPATALVAPNSVAISRSAARAYFGNDAALGKVLTLGAADYRVNLVFADLPENTHLRYDVLISYDTLPDANPDFQVFSFFQISAYTYVRMQENFDPADFQRISQSIYDRYMTEFGSARGTKVNYVLEDLTEIHHKSPAQYDQPHGNEFNMYAYAAVAAFVLLMGCINYVNLATVRSSREEKEISMRKIMGANKPVLVFQYLVESFLFVLIAVVLGFALAELTAAAFPLAQYLGMSSTELVLPSQNLSIVALVALLCLVAGLCAGAYPAFYLSAFSPLLAFAQEGKHGKTRISLRSALVVLQFTISVVVIASTLLTTSQLNFLFEKPLGFDKDNRIVIDVRSADTIERLPTYIDQLEQMPGIRGVFSAASLPGSEIFVTLVEIENNEGAMQSEKFSHIYVDPNFVEVMGAELVAGRSFDETRELDRTAAIVVNEAAVRQMGWENPIGKRFKNSEGLEAQVIGVVRDFHFNDLHEQISPMALVWHKPDYSAMSPAGRLNQTRKLVIHLDAQGQRNTIDRIAQSWDSFSPEYPFAYQYLDDILNEAYVNEENMMGLLSIFSIICIFVSSLGLYGLSAFITQRRSKEISIRRVLGANASQIMSMLCRSIVPAVVVASLAGSYISYVAIKRWLEGFFYSGPFDSMPFLVAAAVVLVVALMTILLQSHEVIKRNAALVLRQE